MTDQEAQYVVTKWFERSGPNNLVQLVHDAIAYQAKKAGKVSSERKKQSSRLNGLKGGRPKK